MSVSNDESTKKRLFLAGIRVFARKGFKAATVREICREAKAGNINSVSYYFGSKEGLYNAILDMMFAAHQSHLDKYPPTSTPLDRLKTFIISYCCMLYGGGEIAQDIIKIFTAEMAGPSKALGQIVEKQTRPQTMVILQAVRELLGPQVPEDAVRDTCISIGSQIIYYSYAWPVFSAVFPDHPGMAAYHEKLADHIIRFSLGGVQAVKQHYSEDSVKATDTERKDTGC